MFPFCLCRAAFALKPKDEKFTAPRYSPSNRSAESPEEIKARIDRLSQTLSNAVTLPPSLPSLSLSQVDLCIQLDDHGMGVNKLLNLGTGVEATRWWGEDKEADK